MGWNQLSSYRYAEDGIGWCLRQTQSTFSVAPQYPDARTAWDGQKGRHTDYPPLGIAVPIWFDHWGNYGNPPYYKNWGHVATQLPDGRVLTSPFWPKTYGYGIFPNIQAMMNALGGNARYLGWSEWMHNKQIVSYTSAPTPQPQPPLSGQEEDEDLKPICVAKNLKGDQVEVTIFSFDTGEEHVFLSTRDKVGQSYNKNVALTYGCAPQVPISYISESHYDRIRMDNKATRERLKNA